MRAWLAYLQECPVIWVHYPSEDLSVWKIQLALRRYLQVISAVRSDEMSAPFQKHIIKDMIAAIANTKLKEIEQIYVCKIVSYDKQPPLPLT